MRRTIRRDSDDLNVMVGRWSVSDIVLAVEKWKVIVGEMIGVMIKGIGAGGRLIGIVGAV